MFFVYTFSTTEPIGSASALASSPSSQLVHLMRDLRADELLLIPYERRLELFLVLKDGPAVDLVQQKLEGTGLLSPKVAVSTEFLSGREAVRYFFGMAIGIAANGGDRNHLERMRQQFAQAVELELIGPIMNKLSQRSIWLHEKARMDTDYFRYAVREESVLSELAGKIFGSLRELQVFVTGIDSSTAAFLDELRKDGCQRFVFLQDGNRRDPLLDSFQGTLRRLSDFPDPECDILLVFDPDFMEQVASRGAAWLLNKRNKEPLLLFDATSSSRELQSQNNMYVYARDDLGAIVRHNRSQQKHAIEKIAAWIDKEVEQFMTWLSSDERFQFAGMIGASASMQRIFELISRVAQTDITILIEGESGTGKELVAKAIHQLSARDRKPFITVNCGAIPENLLESELFGHERGAFTGAVSQKNGLFELAHGGTIFLDEVAELPAHLQVKLLRFLQEGEIKRVGSNDIVKLDVRVLAATNKHIGELVEQGLFRSDLFYRLNVLQLVLPALRDRRQDIPLLAQSFLRKFARKIQKNVVEISAEAMQMLVNYAWPGNVRELENALERAVALAVGRSIMVHDLPPHIQSSQYHPFSINGEKRLSLKEVEKNYILDTLDYCNWNYEAACRHLGIGRTTLWRKLKEYNLEQPLQK